MEGEKNSPAHHQQGGQDETQAAPELMPRGLRPRHRSAARAARGRDLWGRLLRLRGRAPRQDGNRRAEIILLASRRRARCGSPSARADALGLRASAATAKRFAHISRSHLQVPTCSLQSPPLLPLYRSQKLISSRSGKRVSWKIALFRNLSPNPGTKPKSFETPKPFPGHS